MIGEVTIVRNTAYLQVNDQGTIERLPQIKWLARIWLYASTRFRKWSIGEVREYARRHSV